MSYAINNLPSCITIGRETETAVTEIRIDCAEWLDRWSNMDVSVIVRTGRGAIYIPANLTMEGKTLVWCVDDVDTSILNKSTMEITGIAPDRHKLSEKVDILVDERLAGTTGETPDPMKPWVDRVIEAANTVGDARDDAVSAKDEAFDSANVAYKAAFDARESEKNAHASKQEAAQSANIAKDAEENTRATLVTVNGLAEYAKSSAEMAKESEEKSLQNANNAGTYATSAKESERIARESGETAKTSAQSAQTSAGSAAESANQAKRSEEAAKGYADNTGEYARIATEKAQKATEQANSAGVSATSAEESANRASASEQNAATSAQEAKSSADSTKGYSESANEAAVNASDSAREAQVSAENAAASANNAEASKASAQVSAENARVSSQNAEDALQELRDKIASGEFKGDPGEPGKDAVVDATLTQSGQAADAKVTGQAISQLKGDIGDFTADYEIQRTLTDADYTVNNGYFMKYNGVVGQSALWDYYVIPVSVGEKYTITTTANQDIVAWIERTSGQKILRIANRTSSQTEITDTIVISDGAAELVVNHRTADSTPTIIKKTESEKHISDAEAKRIFEGVIKEDVERAIDDKTVYTILPSFTDANNIVSNCATSYIDGAGKENVPNTNGGIITTFFGNLSSIGYQLFIDDTGEFYYRYKYGTWREWLKVSKFNTPITVSDLNDAPINSAIGFTNTTGKHNLPENNAGTLLTFSGASGNVTVQLYNTQYNKTYIRRKWGSDWTAWKSFETEDSGGNLLAMYEHLTFCGDSLTYSQVYTADGSRKARQTYPQIVSKLTGVAQDTYATPGYTPGDWWNAYKSNIISRQNNLYIVYLGTNGGLTDTIDTDCPDGRQVDEYADTNTGNYGKILKSIHDLGEKAVLIKVYGGTTIDTTNSVIEKLGEKFDFPVINNANFKNDCYHLYPDKSGSNGLHYNDLGYARFANYVIDQINAMSDTMLARLVN